MKRRSFIKQVLNGTIGGSLYLVWPMNSMIRDGSALDVPEQIPGIRDKEYDIKNQDFAFIVAPFNVLFQNSYSDLEC